MNNQTLEQTYQVGETVPEDGWYACVPCGNKMRLKAGDRFGNCLQCFKPDEQDDFAEGLELWEKIK